jgi:two-component system nitrate/nitrite response regulator NarL
MGDGSAGARTSLRLMTTAANESGAPLATPDTGGAIRVLVVADVCVYRELLAEALARFTRIDVCGGTPVDVAAMAIAMDEPAVVLVDSSSELGPAGVRSIAASAPAAKIVAVGVPDHDVVLLEYLEAGVAGYVTDEQPLAELVETIEGAAAGELRCSPRLAAALAERVAALKEARPQTNGEQALTRRQREIAALISEGLSNKQIARRLSIQQATVKNHVHNILGKLGVSHRDEVATLFRASMLQG